MSLPHPPKRRRLDSALHKPFRSPLKNPSTPKQSPPTIPTPPPSDLEPPTAKSYTVVTTVGAPKTPQPRVSNPPSSLAPPNTNHITTSTTTPPSPQILRSRATHLQSTLLTSKARLENSTQALAIEQNPAREISLTLLAEKWRKASRTAAEEVFAGARDKVNRMGGLKGMKEREREREDRWGGRGWGEEDGGRGEGGRGEEGEDGEDGEGREEEGERERERMEMKREMEEEMEKERERAEEEKEEVDEEGGYTMDMMLKSMGIDLRLIGFDKELQRWVD